MCRSICEGRSRPRQWGTENKEPAEISARLGLQRTAGGTEGGRDSALKAGALEMLSCPHPQQTAS